MRGTNAPPTAGCSTAKRVSSRSKYTAPSLFSHGSVSRTKPWSMQPAPRFSLGASEPQLRCVSCVKQSATQRT